jgi:hypothetical protein
MLSFQSFAKSRHRFASGTEVKAVHDAKAQLLIVVEAPTCWWLPWLPLLALMLVWDAEAWQHYSLHSLAAAGKLVQI